MKKPIFTLIISSFILVGNIFSQTCLPGGITFARQTQVDSFALNYPGCLEIIGDVTIEEDQASSIVDLSGLIQLTKIGGNLYIWQNSSLADLTGLGNLTSIGGELDFYLNDNLSTIQALSGVSGTVESIWIDNNSSLTNLTGLNNITAVNGNVLIDNNSVLTSLSGLNNITTVPGIFSLESNYLLSDLSALNNLTSIKDLVVEDMPLLTNLNFLSGTSITGTVYVAFNSSITSLDGLQNVTTLQGDLVIYFNPNLTSLNGLNNLNQVASFFALDFNDTLNDISALSSLNSVSESVEIYRNPNLTNLNGLNNLISVGLNLEIIDNLKLNNISALTGLNLVDGDIIIEDNPELKSLNGLNNITTIVGSIIIRDNDLLSTCHVESICMHLDSAGNAMIVGNATGCKSVQEVKDSCEYEPNTYANVLHLDRNTTIYPNPTYNVFTIEINNHKTNKVKITDFSGKTISEQSIKGAAQIDLSNQSGGVYFIQIQTDDISITKKIVKL